MIYTFVTRATSYTQLGNFYEEMYGLEPHQRGYISSYQRFLGFIVQAVLVGPVMAWSGGERQTAAFLAIVLASVVELPLALSHRVISADFTLPVHDKPIATNLDDSSGADACHIFYPHGS